MSIALGACLRLPPVLKPTRYRQRLGLTGVGDDLLESKPSEERCSSRK